MLLLLAAGVAHAQTEVYVCLNENGTKEYKNTGATRGCKRVDLQSVAMIPAPASSPSQVSAPRKAASPVANSRPAASPGDFPRIASGTQKARDNDRLQILSDELKAEETKLATLRQEFNNGEPERRGDERNYAKYQERVAGMKEDIGRAEKNVEALKRELSNLK